MSGVGARGVFVSSGSVVSGIFLLLVHWWRVVGDGEFLLVVIVAVVVVVVMVVVWRLKVPVETTLPFLQISFLLTTILFIPPTSFSSQPILRGEVW